MQELAAHLAGLGLHVSEGSSSPEERDYLASLTRQVGARLVGEVGFNAGYSSYEFLACDPDVEVVSFDIGAYEHVGAAKAFIDERFPGRHTLVVGDSCATVPAFREEHPGTVFDLVFIDGGHDYEVVRSDILNMRELSGDHTVVVMDDLTPWLTWGAGPTRAWLEATEEGVVEQRELFIDGAPAEVIEPPGERAWASGRYLR